MKFLSPLLGTVDLFFVRSLLSLKLLTGFFVLLFSQKLLKTSLQLQERLTLLQVKSDLLSSVFGQEKADDLLKELSGDMRKRELLHSQLQARKSRLQVSHQSKLYFLCVVLYKQSLPCCTCF